MAIFALWFDVKFTVVGSQAWKWMKENLYEFIHFSVQKVKMVKNWILIKKNKIEELV